VLIFCISQGSVGTHLRCGEKYDMRPVANVLLSATVEEFLKLTNTSQSYERISSGTLFMTHGVVSTTRRPLGTAHLPPTKVFRQLSE